MRPDHHQLSTTIFQRSFAILFAFVLSLGCGSEEIPVAGDTCDTIVDCAAAERLACLGSTCAEIECERSLACPSGAACVDGFCDDPECAEDADCGEGVCYEGDCRDDLCSGNDSCPSGLICMGSPPQCVDPPEECENDLQCPVGTFCKLPQATCSILCDQESDCAGEAYCDGRFCREPCIDASDCPGDSICVVGRCEDPPDCDGRACPAGNPFLNPLTCECTSCLADGDCAFADGERCLGGVCRFCPVQTEQSEVCIERGFQLSGECCVECVADIDCTVGNRRECERGACVEERLSECSGDADCPTGRACRQGTCRKTGSAEACTSQADCPEGEACYGDGRCWAQADVCGDCSAPSRCIAEDGDLEGTCAGCTDACDGESCPDGKVCQIADGQVEGVCVDENFTPLCPS